MPEFLVETHFYLHSETLTRGGAEQWVQDVVLQPLIAKQPLMLVGAQVVDVRGDNDPAPGEEHS